MDQKKITQREFTEDEHAKAAYIARRLGYTQFAYTSSSALIGLFCLRDRATQRAGCVIATEEFGLMFVQDCEDLNMEDLKKVYHEDESDCGDRHTDDAEDFARGT